MNDTDTLSDRFLDAIWRIAPMEFVITASAACMSIAAGAILGAVN